MKDLLVDTSVVIDFLRSDNKESTLLYKLASQKINLQVSIVTHAELYAGESVWKNKKAEMDLENLFSGLKLIPMDRDISKQAGYIKFKYKLDLIDAIIASTAVKYKMELVTLNIKEFKKIKELKHFTL